MNTYEMMIKHAEDSLNFIIKKHKSEVDFMVLQINRLKLMQVNEEKTGSLQ